jgi:nucleoside-diphosphate-sugar epimerase
MYGGRSLSDVAAVNVEGTRRVLEGAEKAGVLQAVHVSSVAVYGNAPGILDETRSLDSALPAWDFYGRTKRGGEVVARDYQDKGRLGVTILRPPALYGERDRWLTPRTIRSLSRSVVPLPNGGRASFPVVYAGNLAQAVEMALEGHAAGEVVNVADDLHLTLRSFLRGIANEMGLRPRFVNVPGVLAQGVAAILESVGVRVPGAGDLSLKRMVRLASDGNPYSSEKARSVLGWKPPFTFEEALTRTGSWIRKGKQPDGSSKGSV